MDTLYTVLLCIGIALLLILLVLIYSGLLHIIDIERINSPYPALRVAYKFSTGPYKNCGSVFQATANLAPQNKCFGIYYDDPNSVPEKDLRWIVGSILDEEGKEPDSELCKQFESNGYTLKTLPKVDMVIRSLFPYRTRLSIFLAIYRVWKAVGLYMKKTDCEAHPWLEIYTKNEIHFVGILDHNEAYYVDEVKTKPEEAK